VKLALPHILLCQTHSVTCVPIIAFSGCQRWVVRSHSHRQVPQSYIIACQPCHACRNRTPCRKSAQPSLAKGFHKSPLIRRPLVSKSSKQALKRNQTGAASVYTPCPARCIIRCAHSKIVQRHLCRVQTWCAKYMSWQMHETAVCLPPANKEACTNKLSSSLRAAKSCTKQGTHLYTDQTLLTSNNCVACSATVPDNHDCTSTSTGQQAQNLNGTSSVPCLAMAAAVALVVNIPG